ncbi:hypothetical protein N7541_005530 [Penicillium brevicompactum]|uniref:Cytochrome b5 heme-binding domain-containing protein n=1 Tax=Penicillium brevicompactum TaxID=5074 RepID=A0A9W9R6J5_PENBR|nr:hypothetical protein N7541_005530 [Penicillium brevicompactum]
MSEIKDLTFQEIAEHNTKKDLYLIVHDKVYDCTSFVDEHPGGEEVLLDVGGQDSTEAFEDVGHSDEAREILDGMLVGNVKRMVSPRPPFGSLKTLPNPNPPPTFHSPHPSAQDLARAKSHVPHTPQLFSPCTNHSHFQPGDPEPKQAHTASDSSSSSSSTAGFGVGLYAVILIGGAIAYGAYNYLQAQQAQQQ